MCSLCYVHKYFNFENLVSITIWTSSHQNPVSRPWVRMFRCTPMERKPDVTKVTQVYVDIWQILVYSGRFIVQICHHGDVKSVPWRHLVWLVIVMHGHASAHTGDCRSFAEQTLNVSYLWFLVVYWPANMLLSHFVELMASAN